MAAEFLISRAEGAPRTTEKTDELGIPMFFQMWKVRQDPYATLADGDTLWWVDQRTREVRWEFRVANLRRTRYGSVREALDWLRRWFGLLPSDLTAYHLNTPGEGWLMAWENTVVGPVGVTLPAEVQLGRNGFRRIDATARPIGLPAPGRPAQVEVSPIDETATILANPRVRHIPLATRLAVYERDKRRCQQCSTTGTPMHIDHIFPWSKGGSNELDNLQVLCAPCNLTKGAAVAGTEPVLPVLPEIVDLGARIGTDAPHTVDGLQSLVHAAVAAGHHRASVDLAWALFHHPDGTKAILQAVAVGLDGVSAELCEHVELFRVLMEGDISSSALARFATSNDPDVATRAAAELSLNPEITPDQQMVLARIGLDAKDPRVRALAALTVLELTEDDGEWRQMFTFAFEHGDPTTRSQAAYLFGDESDDADVAYELLELALRSPSPAIAARAARSLARLFADEHEIAARYLRIADQLDTEGNTGH